MRSFVKTKVTQGGRIVIPAEMRKQLGIEIGEDVNLSISDGAVRISSRTESLQRLRQLARSVSQKGGSIVDELIAERREEAKHE